MAIIGTTVRIQGVFTDLSGIPADLDSTPVLIIYDSDKNIERILYCRDTLYTLSPGRIKANTLAGLEEIGALHIP